MDSSYYGGIARGRNLSPNDRKGIGFTSVYSTKFGRCRVESAALSTCFPGPARRMDTFQIEGQVWSQEGYPVLLTTGSPSFSINGHSLRIGRSSH